MPVKVVLFYNQYQRGWTETWYKPGNVVPFNVLTADVPIFSAAIAFRAPGTELYAVRYSDVDNPRRSSLVILQGYLDNRIPSSTRPDVVTTDAVYTIVSDLGAKRRISLRGLNDRDTVRLESGVDQLGPNLVALIPQYLNQVRSAGWLIRLQSTPRNSALTFNPVFSLDENLTPRNTTAILCSNALAAGFVQGARVRFTGNLQIGRAHV